jgi:mannose-6-phosphate isomerase-like protein (cupin superfamily)
MVDYTAKNIGQMETGFGGGFVKARAELGVTAFGMQVIQLPPDYGDYPEHDHAESGQEEVFLAIGGSGWIEIEGERVDLDRETFVRVGPETRRKIHAGPDGIRLLAIGGAPGEAYKIVPLTELGASS